MEMKSVSHRYDLNRPGSRHGHKYSKYKKYLSMMMLICTKQHIRNISSWIHGKVKQHWGWVEKKRCHKKSVYLKKSIKIKLLINFSNKNITFQNSASFCCCYCFLFFEKTNLKRSSANQTVVCQIFKWKLKKSLRNLNKVKYLEQEILCSLFFDMYILNTRKHGYSLHVPRSVNGFNVLLETVTSFLMFYRV